MKIFAVIMAGGVGSRFWPRSTKQTPKQLLKIFGNATLIQNTVSRLEGLVETENIYVITNKLQRPEIIRQLSQLKEENVIEEPFGRNTAACIGFASLIIQQKNHDAVTLVLPADHIIENIENFQKVLKSAAEFAFKSNGLVTIGIQPTKPETGYGYIQIDESSTTDEVAKVYSFAEKPNYATAVRFLESGDFFWNSGMFIWKASTILEEIRNFMPELYAGLMRIKQAMNTPEYQSVLLKEYGQFKKISIDYGVMEKSNKVYLIKGSFKWSDVGSWDAVYQLSEKDSNGNAISGKVYTDMVVDSYIYSPDKLVAAIGVDNLIIINTEKSILICRRDQGQEVKKVVDYLKLHKMEEYL
ncbi:MAG: NTP transferase domain-containing protein [Ignavibacteriaceae bacterium]|nr:NTP transferase domain-containing protein [Ignavibacteriaceae bacterium]